MRMYLMVGDYDPQNITTQDLENAIELTGDFEWRWTKHYPEDVFSKWHELEDGEKVAIFSRMLEESKIPWVELRDPWHVRFWRWLEA